MKCRDEPGMSRRQPSCAPPGPCARRGCRRSRGPPGRGRPGGRSRPGSRAKSTKPGAGRTACRSPSSGGQVFSAANRSTVPSPLVVEAAAARATRPRASSAAPSAVRARAWICGFSSTLKATTAFAACGRARYRPATSRTLSISSGSGEILKGLWSAQGCSPNARQIRSTLDGEMPGLPGRLPLGPVRGTVGDLLPACAPPPPPPGAAGDSARHARTRLDRAIRPVGPTYFRKRARHLRTVLRATPSRAATATLLPPPAQASTIRARSARPCAVLRRRIQFSNVRRSSEVSTSGSSLLSPMPPADRTHPPAQAPDQEPGTGTQHDSCGDQGTPRPAH